MTGDAAGPRSPEAITDPIGEFYTRHPYPPPVENLDRARDDWRTDPNRARAEFHLFWPRRPYRAELNVLVAGCGTWQAAKFALTHPSAQVTAIDVSATSIEHTGALKQKYDLANLDIRQLAIEDVRDLQREFDLIICTGVLHHLADPDAGLTKLRSVLMPDGAMYLMVYAPYGRTGVYMLQEYCRRLGLGTSDDDIEGLIQILQALPTDHPLVRLLHGSRDARDPDALADALLNPRDRAYSVAQVFDLVERAGLTFGRWYWQAPYRPECGAIAKTPHAARLAALPERDQFAALELWRGTMTAHSFIVHGHDSGDGFADLRLDDDRWLAYVPVRLPWTQLVEESLPPGAAGVLVNRSHRFRDLILVLRPEDRRLFDRVDGQRSIAEMLRDASSIERGQARAFFDSLWRYDQVTFDASAP